MFNINGSVLNAVLIIGMLSSSLCMANTPPKNIITKDGAAQIAKQAQSGRMNNGELEYENGRWIYSFEITGKDQRVNEVNVDALTGQVVSKTVETRATEQREKKEDMKLNK